MFGGVSNPYHKNTKLMIINGDKLKEEKIQEIKQLNSFSMDLVYINKNKTESKIIIFGGCLKNHCDHIYLLTLYHH